MLQQLLGQLALPNIIVSLLILAVFIGLAWLFRALLLRMAKRLAQKTQTKLDDVIVSALGKPVLAIIVLAGLYLAVIPLSLEGTVRLYVFRGLIIALSLLGIYTVLALIDALVNWYNCEMVGESVGVLTRRLLSLFRVGAVAAAILVAIIVVANILGIKLTPVIDWLGKHGWRIAFIFILSIVTILLICRFVPRVMETTMGRRTGESEQEVKKRANTLSRVTVNIGQVVVFLIAIFMVLSELEIDIGPILAGVGVAGIAIGFGAQSLVKDLLAGLFIILESQYRVGDVVRIADIAGLVEDINLRRTVLRDLDGIVHVVPNGEIRVASNFTKEWSRVNLNISVAYGEDLDHVISVINRVGKELTEDPQWAPLILKAPQALRVDNLGNSGIEIKILGDTQPIRQWDVMGELRKRLKKAFDEEGIEIPWPHTKVYFGNSPYENGGQGSNGGKHK
ncbi:MAG: mechanosensitive ion channel family protein [Chloroflexota bacterium]